MADDHTVACPRERDVGGNTVCVDDEDIIPVKPVHWRVIVAHVVRTERNFSTSALQTPRYESGLPDGIEVAAISRVKRHDSTASLAIHDRGHARCHASRISGNPLERDYPMSLVGAEKRCCPTGVGLRQLMGHWSGTKRVERRHVVSRAAKADAEARLTVCLHTEGEKLRRHARRFALEIGLEIHHVAVIVDPELRTVPKYVGHTPTLSVVALPDVRHQVSRNLKEVRYIGNVPCEQVEGSRWSGIFP